MLYWISTTKQLINGYYVAYAGWDYNSIPDHFIEWLKSGGEQYLKTGKIVYAPFIPSIEMETDFLKNGVSVPNYFDCSSLFHRRNDFNWLDDSQLISLLSLDLPFLDNIDIGTLNAVKNDNLDEFKNFSKVISVAIEEIKSNFHTPEFIKEVKKIQRDVIDDGLDKLDQKLK